MMEMTRAVPVSRPPRSIAWVLLLASAAAVLLTGLVATVVIVNSRIPAATSVPVRFWPRLLLAMGLTMAGISLRALRWIYLLRRADTRIPIRDAYIGYFAGFSLLFAPFFLGEIGVRAWVLRQRGGVPTGVTAVLSLWERWYDLLALLAIGGALGAAAADPIMGLLSLAGVVTFLSVPGLRSGLLAVLTALVNRAGAWSGGRIVPPLPRLTGTRTACATLLAGIVAWVLPAWGFGLLAGAFLDSPGQSGAPGTPDLSGTLWMLGMPGVNAAMSAFTASTLRGGLLFVPGGVVVTGNYLLAWLAAMGADAADAAMIVLSSRLATVGVSTVFGLTYLLMHVRHPQPHAGDHFDAIADAYDVQIPEARRLALLTRKTAMMRAWLDTHGGGRRGLDVGCGQGWYIARMRTLGFDVTGIDYSAGQVMLAGRHLGDPTLVRVGSALSIPAADSSIDFAYTINVLHHLPSVADQRAAFREILRVLRPGGVLFVHEINTTNPVFRFYMGYVFPSLNCIDEGVERWLLPAALPTYTEAALVDVRYFTFFPDFMPQFLVRLCAPMERWLERSPLRSYSAHYMAVLRKAA